MSKPERDGVKWIDKALASGGHIVTTDFPSGEAYPKTGYVVQFPGNAPARWNPVNAPKGFEGCLFEEK